MWEYCVGVRLWEASCASNYSEDLNLSLLMEPRPVDIKGRRKEDISTPNSMTQPAPLLTALPRRTMCCCGDQ